MPSRRLALHLIIHVTLQPQSQLQSASRGSRHGVVPTGRQCLHACAQHRVDDVCDGAAAAEVVDWLREALHERANRAAAR